MGMFIPTREAHRVHTVHRLAAASTGAFLLVFGAVGAVRSPGFLSTSGAEVMGLFTNGLLATLSLLMGVALVFASVRSGPVASTTSVVAGGMFLLSGLVNAATVGSPMNVLAFGVANVLFSLVVGAVLVILGSYGRFSGALPADSPYARHLTAIAPVAEHATVPEDDRAMAEAERAVVLHVATPEQVARVCAASAHRAHQQRLQAFLTPVPAARR